VVICENMGKSSSHHSHPLTNLQITHEASPSQVALLKPLSVGVSHAVMWNRKDWKGLVEA
jgi:hypothetical protein